MIQFTRLQVDTLLGARPHRYLERVASTMDAARNWLDEGAPHGAIVVAGEQTAGRGRVGRVWMNAGGALAISVVLRVPAGSLPRVPMLGGLVVYDALAGLGLTELALKWPNDVLIGGKKVCGVLAETVWEHDGLRGAVLGIGINVGGEFDSAELRETATTVSAALGRDVGVGEVLAAVVRYLDARLAELSSPVVFDAWRGRLSTIGRRVRVEGNSAFEGLAEDVSEHGALLVRADDGQLRTVLAGDVRLRPA
jgi:BirA family transcriptional regulator, biotin operon repressor / biotin---[acetyl-CoA-carboxylase] ligase